MGCEYSQQVINVEERVRVESERGEGYRIVMGGGKLLRKDLYFVSTIFNHKIYSIVLDQLSNCGKNRFNLCILSYHFQVQVW